MKPREPKRKVAQGSMGPCGPPFDPLVKFVVIHDVPLPGTPTVGVLYRQTVNFYQSCVGLEWSAQETTGLIPVRASEE
jgi:hypothetical protein